MKTLLALLLLIPSLSWGDHESSEDLTGKSLSCFNDFYEFIIFFTKYNKEILDYSLFGEDYWSDEHSEFDIRSNQNIVYMYTISKTNNKPRENFLTYQTDLTSIVLLTPGYYEKPPILHHKNKYFNGESTPSNFIGKINRQNLTFTNSSDIVNFCKLVDGDPIKYIDIYKKPYLESEKNKLERLKRNQKI